MKQLLDVTLKHVRYLLRRAADRQQPATDGPGAGAGDTADLHEHACVVQRLQTDRGTSRSFCLGTANFNVKLQYFHNLEYTLQNVPQKLVLICNTNVVEAMTSFRSNIAFANKLRKGLVNFIISIYDNYIRGLKKSVNPPSSLVAIGDGLARGHNGSRTLFQSHEFSTITVQKCLCHSLS